MVAASDTDRPAARRCPECVTESRRPIDVQFPSVLPPLGGDVECGWLPLRVIPRPPWASSGEVFLSLIFYIFDRDHLHCSLMASAGAPTGMITEARLLEGMFSRRGRTT